MRTVRFATLLVGGALLSLAMPACDAESQQAGEETPAIGSENDAVTDPFANSCALTTADSLMKICPTTAEKNQIMADFHITFDSSLGNVLNFTCTKNGTEASLGLNVFNMFRMMRCTPYSRTFPFATTQNNLYSWVKSLNLTSINFFAGSGLNNGGNGVVNLNANTFGAASNRQVINPSTGTGMLFLPILLAHEARHASGNFPHNCPDLANDTNFAYNGAWTVQYDMDKMDSMHSGTYFTSGAVGEQAFADAAAQTIVNSRFCQAPGTPPL
jgi:hypothetical protein